VTIEIDLHVLDCDVTLRCDDSATADVLSRCYSALLHSRSHTISKSIRIRVRSGPQEVSWTVSFGASSSDCCDLDELLYAVDKALTLELQHQRSDLFFVHGAALAKGNRCIVISGESGSGKSTLCWQLCGAGFEYMSDELAPIDLRTTEAHPYPHALCLKSVAPGAVPLPASTINAGRTLHVPVSSLQGGVRESSTCISAFVFLQGDLATERPEIRTVCKAEAAARIFANGLNQLAHEKSGLGAASKLANTIPSYLLPRGSIAAMSDQVTALLNT